MVSIMVDMDKMNQRMKNAVIKLDKKFTRTYCQTCKKSFTDSCKQNSHEKVHIKIRNDPKGNFFEERNKITPQIHMRKFEELTARGQVSYGCQK